jgi:hypothetical protein
MIMELDKDRNLKERGQSLTELALFLTFLFVLLAGIVDIGRAFFTYIALRDAAQEGALYASFEEVKCQNTQARVKATNDDLGSLIDSGEVTVQCTVIGPACGDKDSTISGAVEVRVSYENFPITMPFLGTLVGGQTISISATSTDNILTPVCASSVPPS